MRQSAPRLAWIGADDPPGSFPPVDQALTEPDGLLAAGGDLSTQRLLYAYRRGIFPWYDEGQPILWWSPNLRCILRPADLHIARRLRRWLRTSGFEVTFNRSFDAVIDACAENRPGQRGTWITPDMNRAYRRLHRIGWAHSVEVWQEDTLAGGIYGLAIDRVFFGESMFTRIDNASKAAMIALCSELVKGEFQLLDCQIESPHLASLGAVLIPRRQFSALLAAACVAETQRNFSIVEPAQIGQFL